MLAAAPSALAETTTSCPSAAQERANWSALTMAGTCAGFPDHGAPYVFRIGTLYAWRLVGLDVLLVPVGPATESCTAYEVLANGVLRATGCKYVA
ncbi:hypothetical protein Q5425_01300 [Amycolatopsis sp. A133]|uniref:hypothetical protein n=1 Tax=Amycolatopsis sp. A133 TaxID=3064472 RepID=UPI0027FF146D|nr:hypothetical protein [Amycolatopsis sp. A133]MDQ7802348.1 hypothetical protein [Amycolatopsis sp. A133]